ncbi:metalloendopeptidase OMA1, mitochondrial isoform X2 [Cynoglossus semilaevis]|uniref:metalloendopeptidase OMA1, mitochondrial isoform X2 n=1 Tax=Cynoglossus semilaevis TaxID=244447 RepID=UPI0007DC9554|nr:metalloendopeptidase OMA1, mitochondrial isoform X2 [Cynoglossus semilaevis]
MFYLSVHLLGCSRLSPLPAHLARCDPVRKQVGRLLTSPHFSCQKSTNSASYVRATPTWRPLLSYNNWSTLRCTKTTSFLLRSARVQTRCGHFHTSAALSALPPPLLWLVLKPLQKLIAIILGRSIRKWWAALPDNRRHLVREWAWLHRWHLTAGLAFAVVIAALLLLTHLDESPLTGRIRLLVFSRENYMELAALTSEAYMEEFADLLLPVTDHRHVVVERVVQHLAQRNKDISEVSDVAWSVHVVQSPNTNAFVLPNGKVFMFTGMLDAVTDVHQLTVVLGHEMAHAILGHSFMFNRPYSRKLEAEADKIGLQLAAKACADVRAGPVFWRQMEIREQLTGQPSLPEWLSTHPSHRNRFTQMDSLIPEALVLRERCVCPALPASDPRVIFSRSVQVLLEKAQGQGRGGADGAVTSHVPPSTASLPSAPPAALLPQTALLPAPNLDQVLDSSTGVAPPVSAPTGGVVPQAMDTR